MVGNEVSVMETTKASPKLDAKETAVSGAEVMLLLCDCVVVTSACVRDIVADPEVISSWLLDVLNADCIKSYFHLHQILGIHPDSPTDVLAVLGKEFACDNCARGSPPSKNCQNLRAFTLLLVGLGLVHSDF